MSKRFRRVAEVWSRPESLVAELVRLGFLEPGAGEVAARVVARHYDALSVPRSSETPEADASVYTYAENPRRLSPAAFGLVFVGFDPEDDARPLLRVREPAAALDFVLGHVRAPEWHGESHAVPKGVVAEAGVVIGPDCEIGEGTVLETGVRLGARVRIGRDGRIGAHSRIADDCELGDECRLTGSVSIGGQGFGFVKYPGESGRRPRVHVGRVVVGTGVRLGAFVAIDRGVFEDTQVGDGGAFDNIVQVGHNCVVGREAVLCSFVGLSGSTELGDRVTLAGLVGTKGHMRIGHDVTVAAQSGVSADVPDGQVVKGYPPRPLAEALKIQALVGRLPEFFARLKKLEEKP